MYFAVLKPDKTPIPDIFSDMASAQYAVAAIEPDIIKQGSYQIHPVSHDNEAKDLERIGLKSIEVWTLRKFDGEYVGQPPVEVKVILPEIA
jgi:hypothetical protein